MNVGSLFSGIGGLDHGLARAGFRHAFLCESDPWRRTVLAHHFPGVPIYEDVRDVALGTPDVRLDGGRRDGQDVAREVPDLDGRPARADALVAGEQDARGQDSAIDLLCGGFPCQDVSVAGRRAGLAGERSGLFHEFARVAESLRPRWLLVENVPGLLSSNGGRDFGVVLGTLADIGYGLAWRILDSRFFGVPQRRRRVFIVGALAERDPRAAAERASQVLAVGSRCERHPATRGEAAAAVAPALSGRSPSRLDDQGSGQLIADTVRSHPRPGSNSDGNLTVAGPLGGGNDGIGRRSEDDPNLVTAFSWQQGDDSKWTGTGRGRSWVARAGDYAAGLSASGRHDAISGASVGVRRLTPRECERLQALPDDWTAFGPDSRRYAALGDAVTASVSEWIGRRLRAVA